MSRYTITVNHGSLSDEMGCIGYDKSLRTFFLQGFIHEDENDKRPEIWLGTMLEEYPTLDGVLEAAKKRGYSAFGLEHAAMIAMMAEASQRPIASLGERLGIVR